jgi:hypothetical protein
VRHLIIAFSEQDIAQKIKALLISRGQAVRGVCNAGHQVLQMAAGCEGGGVVICPIRFPDMTAQEIMSLLPESFDMLVLVTPRQQGQISGSGIYTLTQPFNSTLLLDSARQLMETRQLRAASSVVLDRIHRPSSLAAEQDEPGKRETAALHGRSTEEQKIIEQAKYLLMNRRKISEAEAHHYLQRKSMESGIRLVELARQIILPA